MLLLYIVVKIIYYKGGNIMEEIEKNIEEIDKEIAKIQDELN